MVIKNSLITCLVFLILTSCGAKKPEAYDKYGGYKAIQREATGYFRVDTVAGRWMFITPEGHGYLALGANHTGKFLLDSSQSGDFLNRFNGRLSEASHHLYETYLDLGLNAGEAYHPHDHFLTTKLPYVAHVSYPTQSHFARDIFDPLVRDSIYKGTVEQCAPFRYDSLVLGIGFKDLPNWSSRRVDFYRGLPHSAPGKKQYAAFLKQRYQNDISPLNAIYQTSFSSFDALAQAQDWQLDEENVTIKGDDGAFMGVIADTLYTVLQKAVKTAAPSHLFFGERYQLRSTPDPVLRSVGKYVDVFLTQALIRSPQRPPEWQVFQEDGYAHEYSLTGKPMMIIDWATPFSLGESYQTDRGHIKKEALAAADMAEWLQGAFNTQYIIGVFKCQLIGSHGNDRWFPKGNMKRTLLKDDGTYFDHMTPTLANAHKEVLIKCYGHVAESMVE